jgi:type I restriction enzyme S subunit
MSNDVLTEWTTLKLGAVFKVKSGESLSAKKIIKGNYPVFGGNGINSYHNQFLFEDPKIVIGRVGAKCGCVYITQPKSWITDNALYVHDKTKRF